MSDVLRCSPDVFRCSQMFSDDLRMLSFAHRCSLDVHRCFWMFSTWYLDFLRMFSGYFHDVHRMFSWYLKDTLVGTMGLMGFVGLTGLFGLVGLLGSQNWQLSDMGFVSLIDWDGGPVGSGRSGGPSWFGGSNINFMILVFFVSLYFLNLLQQQHIFRDLSPYRPCQELKNFCLFCFLLN